MKSDVRLSSDAHTRDLAAARLLPIFHGHQHPVETETFDLVAFSMPDIEDPVPYRGARSRVGEPARKCLDCRTVEVLVGGSV